MENILKKSTRNPCEVNRSISERCERYGCSWCLLKRPRGKVGTSRIINVDGTQPMQLEHGVVKTVQAQLTIGATDLTFEVMDQASSRADDILTGIPYAALVGE